MNHNILDFDKSEIMIVVCQILIIHNHSTPNLDNSEVMNRSSASYFKKS